MKLIIFMFAISLCIASPSLRHAHQNKASTDDHPSWIFDQAFNGDADSEPMLSNGEEELENNYLNGAEEEEIIPYPTDEEEEEENNEQTLPNDNSNSNQPNNTDTTNTTTPSEPNTNTTSPSNSSNSYTVLSADEIANSAEVQGALQYGGNQTIQYGYAKKKIPVSIYTIAKVISVGKQAISGGRNSYNCSVEIHDPRGILVKAQYTIYAKVSNQELFVKSWAYQIFNLRYADDPFPVTNNNTTNNTNTDSTPTNNTTVPVDNTTEPVTNTTSPVDNTNTTTNNNTNTTNTTSDSYIPLQPSEIASLQVQDVLSFGANAILQKGIASGKIPQSEYDITQVISVLRKVQNGKTNYICSVELRDENQVSVKAQFTVTVTVKNSKQENFLASWSYQVTSKFSIDETAYTQLNSTEAQDNAEVKSCLDFAIADVIPNSAEFSVAAVNVVYIQTIKNTVYYKFDVELDNHKGKTIDLVCTVAYKPASDSRDVKTYSTKTTTVNKK